MTPAANIVEIFSSRQGEGPHAGERMTFVRFEGCSLGCRYCDTPQGRGHLEHFRVEEPPGSGQFVLRPNPAGAAALSEALAAFDDPTVAVTGGEPLEHAAFLAEWLPSVAAARRVLLETNGIHAKELARVLPFVHIVSMDIKLPSSAGIAPRWADHEAFLRTAVASRRETYVKIVVTAETADRDLEAAIALVARTNKFLPVVIQPASPTLAFHHPAAPERIDAVERLCGAYLPDVRVIPQMHKQWGVL